RRKENQRATGPVARDSRGRSVRCAAVSWTSFDADAVSHPSVAVWRSELSSDEAWTDGDGRTTRGRVAGELFRYPQSIGREALAAPAARRCRSQRAVTSRPDWGARVTAGAGSQSRRSR